MGRVGGRVREMGRVGGRVREIGRVGDYLCCTSPLRAIAVVEQEAIKQAQAGGGAGKGLGGGGGGGGGRLGDLS